MSWIGISSCPLFKLTLFQVQNQILFFVNRSSKVWKLIKCHELEFQVDHCSSWPSFKFKFKFQFCFLWIGVPNLKYWLNVMNLKFKLTLFQVQVQNQILFFVDRSSKVWKLIICHEFEFQVDHFTLWRSCPVFDLLHKEQS